MRVRLLLLTLMLGNSLFAAPNFIAAQPRERGTYNINGKALCATAKQTLAYLNKGTDYDPEVIHGGKALSIPLWRVKATLAFICQHPQELNDPQFVKQHFDFIRWLPDNAHAKQLATNKPLLKNMPANRLLMTKYYVHLSKASAFPTTATPLALHGLPYDEQQLSIEEANALPGLTRFQYGKQAILAGKLSLKQAPALAYLSRQDLEAALLQGTLVADFGGKSGQKTFNVHRNNNKNYDRLKKPEDQERYWYFKQVNGIKGYGKDAEHKITVDYGVTFAADLAQLGLGKLLMIQYQDQRNNLITGMGILADTGGAFTDNLYQVDFLTGAYPGRDAYYQANRHLPDYVDAYFMILKTKK